LQKAVQSSEKTTVKIEIMMTIDEMNEILNDLADELPEAFFRELSGGVVLVEEARYKSAVSDKDLTILGEYHRGGGMGRYITIYYGSMIRVYGSQPREVMVHHLRRVLRHEFRHHVESLAGNRDLEIEDEKFINEFKQKQYAAENASEQK
jgi:Uncharacterized protein conserved in bacteria